MKESALPRIKEAWREAADFDVASALNSLDSYADHAVDIIKAEARRRGLRAQDAPRVAPPQTYEAVRKILGPAVRFFTRHRLLAAALYGIVIQLILVPMLPPTTRSDALIRTGVILLASFFCLGGLCWPLRRYRLVMAVTAVFAISMIAASFILRLWLGGFFGAPPAL